MKKFLFIFLSISFVFVFSFSSSAFTASFEPYANDLVYFPTECGLDNFSVSSSSLYYGDSRIIVSQNDSLEVIIEKLSSNSARSMYSYSVHSYNDSIAFERGYIKFPTVNPSFIRDDISTPSDTILRPEIYLLTDGNPSYYSWYLFYDFCYYDTLGVLHRESYTDTYSSSTPAYTFDVNELYNTHNRSGFSFAFIDKLQVTFDCSDGNVYGYDIHTDDVYSLIGSEIVPSNLDVTVNNVNPDITAWLFDSLNGFFEVQIFGDITIGNIFGIALAAPLVIWFLKVFAGG